MKRELPVFQIILRMVLFGFVPGILFFRWQDHLHDKKRPPCPVVKDNSSRHDYLPGRPFQEDSRDLLLFCFPEIKQLRELPQGVAVLSFDRDSQSDHSGVWNVFAPGAGNINKDPADWKWRLSLDLQDNKAIKSIFILHGKYGEGWSTSLQKVYNKELYPLVVFYQGRQLNSVYDQSLGEYYPGRYDFELYGQRESTPFYGAKGIVFFTDGTFAAADTGMQLDNAQQKNMPQSENGGIY